MWWRITIKYILSIYNILLRKTFNITMLFLDVSMKFDRYTDDGIEISERIKLQLRQTSIEYVHIGYVPVQRRIKMKTNLNTM